GVCGKLLGHSQAEMGGLHRDVGVESLGGDPVQTLEVAVHRRQGSLLVVDLLSEEVEGDLKAVCVERSGHRHRLVEGVARHETTGQDRKSTRLNSSHVKSSYAVFCLKKKTRSRAKA